MSEINEFRFEGTEGETLILQWSTGKTIVLHLYDEDGPGWAAMFDCANALRLRDRLNEVLGKG